MTRFPKPVVVVSGCLEFAPCRYNGERVPFDFIRKLQPHVSFVTICPEVEIGLGVPRDPIRIVSRKGRRRLLQPSTGLDLTQKMRRFSEAFLDSLKAADGFILKSRSPSCALRDAKEFAGREDRHPLGKGAGFFGGAALARFPGLALEDEERLADERVRDHFLTRLFILARFRVAKKSGSSGRLLRFHAANEFLIMAHHQKELRLLGRIIADREKGSFGAVAGRYEAHLGRALSRPPRTLSNINVLLRALGHLSKELTAKEKARFLDALESYRSGKTSLRAASSLLNAWIARSGDERLMGQTFFEPYPAALMEAGGSGKGGVGRRANRP